MFPRFFQCPFFKQIRELSRSPFSSMSVVEEVRDFARMVVEHAVNIIPGVGTSFVKLVKGFGVDTGSLNLVDKF